MQILVRQSLPFATLSKVIEPWPSKLPNKRAKSGEGDQNILQTWSNNQLENVGSAASGRSQEGPSHTGCLSPALSSTLQPHPFSKRSTWFNMNSSASIAAPFPFPGPAPTADLPHPTHPHTLRSRAQLEDFKARKAAAAAQSRAGAVPGRAASRTNGAAAALTNGDAAAGHIERGASLEPGAEPHDSSGAQHRCGAGAEPLLADHVLQQSASPVDASRCWGTLRKPVRAPGAAEQQAAAWHAFQHVADWAACTRISADASLSIAHVVHARSHKCYATAML